MPAFTTDILIRFQHTDPARMVFYPRYFEIINQVIEDWFDQGLGCDYEELHGKRGLGIPTVRIECEFARPSRLGEVLEFRLEVERIGTASFAVRIVGWRDEELRLRDRQVLVFASIETNEPVQIPEDIRARMAHFVTEEEA